MAKAPKPGVGREQAEAEQAGKIMTITIGREITTAKGRTVPETHTLAVDLIPIREQVIIRKATGLPFSAFWSEDRVAADSIAVLWWVARRANGEVTLTWAKAQDEWPLDLDYADEVDIDFDDGEPDDDDDEDATDADPEG